MTDFEKYLGKWIVWSGEDCCSKCANSSINTNGELCANLKEHTGDAPPDDDICLQGMKKYFEEHKEADDGIDN